MIKNLLVTAFGGKIREHKASVLLSSQCNLESQWAPPWQWRQRGGDGGSKALLCREGLVQSSFVAAGHCEHGSLRAASEEAGRKGHNFPSWHGVWGEKRWAFRPAGEGVGKASRPAAQSTVLKPSPVSEELTAARPGRDPGAQGTGLPEE